MANSSFTVTGASNVTAVATGTGLQGGTITSTGTINLSTQFAMSHRLTLTSNSPGSEGATAATTLYMTPYKGLDIDVYNGSAWVRFQQTQLSITTSGLSASTTYDVFYNYNSGTPNLVLTAWSNSGAGTGARATALAYQDGVLVKSGTPTQRYVGTIYSDASTQFNDVSSLRLLYNYYNRIARALSWTISTASWGQANNNAWEVFNNSGSILPVVVGVVEDNVNIIASIVAGNSGGAFAVGVGINSKTSNTAIINSSSPASASLIGMTAHYFGPPPLGYHYYVPLEYGTTATAGWYANQVANSAAGLNGSLLM